MSKTELIIPKDTKPKNVQQYKEWLKTEKNIDITDKNRVYYETVSNKLKSDFECSDFWKKLTEKLKEFNIEYMMEKKYELLMPMEYEVLVKPFNSLLSKTYRKNIIENENWPNEPTTGWIEPNNWYVKINDIIRTSIVVKYLDGVEFLANKIENLANECGNKCTLSLEAKEEGYYAGHLNVEHEFEIPGEHWDTKKTDIVIEIQITTQLQELIKRLIHKYYIKRRNKLDEVNKKWQWDYTSEEFAPNYLGHILHYVEGMIMEIREKQGETKDED